MARQPKRQADITADGRVCLAAITGAHGVQGEVVAEIFAADPLRLGDHGPLSDGPGGRTFTVRAVRALRKGFAIRLDGVASRNEAEALAGTGLYVARSSLPAPGPDEFYHADLIGLDAATGDGVVIGTVVGVHDFGAGDLLELRPAAGGPTAYVPFTREIVTAVDLSAGRVILDPPAGLIEGVGPPPMLDGKEEGEP